MNEIIFSRAVCAPAARKEWLGFSSEETLWSHPESGCTITFSIHAADHGRGKRGRTFGYHNMMVSISRIPPSLKSTSLPSKYVLMEYGHILQMRTQRFPCTLIFFLFAEMTHGKHAVLIQTKLKYIIQLKAWSSWMPEFSVCGGQWQVTAVALWWFWFWLVFPVLVQHSVKNRAEWSVGWL